MALEEYGLEFQFNTYNIDGTVNGEVHIYKNKIWLSRSFLPILCIMNRVHTT